MAALKVEFRVVVSVRVCEVPAATLSEVAEDATINVGVGETVTESDAVRFTEPLLAATVAE
jgi:hypothetical protein